MLNTVNNIIINCNILFYIVLLSNKPVQEVQNRKDIKMIKFTHNWWLIIDEQILKSQVLDSIEFNYHQNLFWDFNYGYDWWVQQIHHDSSFTVAKDYRVWEWDIHGLERDMLEPDIQYSYTFEVLAILVGVSHNGLPLSAPPHFNFK